jgi:transposase
VNPDKNSTAHEIEVDYEEAVITEEEIKSKKPEDIQKCLKAGVIPEVYQHQDIAVEITEVTTISKSDKCFKLNEDGETVTCPEGEILNKVANLNKKQATRYVSKAACSHCENKCTTSDFKQVDFKDGQKSVYLKNPPLKKRIVRITIKPDKEKLKERKSIVEHPFGTIKRWNDGSYLLLVGNKGATADLALLFLGYNIKRAINMVGIEKIMEAIEQKG